MIKDFTTIQVKNLPEIGEEGKIYLVPKNLATNPLNIFDEYIWIPDTSDNGEWGTCVYTESNKAEGRWEKLGDDLKDTGKGSYKNIYMSKANPFNVALTYDPNHKIFYKVERVETTSPQQSKLYKSLDGKHWELIYKEAAIHSQQTYFFGPGAIGYVHINNRNLILSVNWRNETLSRIWAYDLDNNTPINNQYEFGPLKINPNDDDNYIGGNCDFVKIYNPKLHKDEYFFFAYNRKGGKYLADGMWRKLAIFKVTLINNTFSFDGRVIVDLTDAPGTPTTINSNAMYISELLGVKVKNNVFLALRAVGDANLEYNKGAYITSLTIDEIHAMFDGSKPFTPIHYDLFYGTSTGEFNLNTRGSYICNYLSEGGHLNGILPKVASFNINGEDYLMVVMYVRNGALGEVLCQLYYILKKIKDDVHQMWKEFPDENIIKLGEGNKNTNSHSPEGGNMGITQTDNSVLISCPSNRTKNVEEFVIYNTEI